VVLVKRVLYTVRQDLPTKSVYPRHRILRPRQIMRQPVPGLQLHRMVRIPVRRDMSGGKHSREIMSV
jgi:hypothetical protein